LFHEQQNVLRTELFFLVLTLLISIFWL